MMKTLLTPIAFNETSLNVALLHQVLKVLGFPVAGMDVEQNKAGQETLDQVRALQKKLGVQPGRAREPLVDEATIAAITEALGKRGLMDSSHSFVVSGAVRLQDGSVKRRQRLLAFDLDLRGVAAYRTVKTVAEIRKSGAFEFLGAAVSDRSGNYEVTFYDWQHPRAERLHADVVVFAIAEDKDGERIIGRSRMVHSGDYSSQGSVQGLDVLITETDERTEYEIVMTALTAFLNESDATLRDIAGSAEQLDFAARELELPPEHVSIAGSAQLLPPPKRQPHAHEWLYGIGRQNIRLVWRVLARKSEVQLQTAIAKSVKERIIRDWPAEQVEGFLKLLRAEAIQKALSDKRLDQKVSLDDQLKRALPKPEQRAGFLDALGSFAGRDFRKFWTEHLPAQPAFKDRPELITRLHFMQQLALLTGNHHPLIDHLLGDACCPAKSVDDLVAKEPAEWAEIVAKTGVPDFIEGADAAERNTRFAEFIRAGLDVAFPTRRIARMIEKNQLPIEKTSVAQGVTAFLARTPHFDFARSRVHDFAKEIEAAAGEEHAAVERELKKIQRVYQVSTSPEATVVLMKARLHSARSIAQMPRQNFLMSHGGALGGEDAASAVYERATHLAQRAERTATYMMEYSADDAPAMVLAEEGYTTAMAMIEKHIPNYSELFGRPDLCECEHCRSVYSPAAYFVDLLRFLKLAPVNGEGRTPLDVLADRRPDLLWLPLTCENTNTVIPYIDLANEVMECFTAHDSLVNFHGYDTGETTASELRANPQNFNLEAYRKLANAVPGETNAVYPFTLPYHQPLDVLRAYSDHLQVSRYDVMRAVSPQPDAKTARALAAESLRLSEAEYKILTGRSFDDAADVTPLHEYFGYGTAAELEGMSAVPEFLRRSGVNYVELVELVETQFINPYQGTLEFLQGVLSFAVGLTGADANAKLAQIEAGALDPAADPVLGPAITAYNAARKTALTPAQFADWVRVHLAEFRQVITLYEPQSKCDLDHTRLRTMKSIGEDLLNSDIGDTTWSKIHRFIRLWKKLGWSIHQTDLMLAALGESDISPGTIAKLESVLRLQAASKLPSERLAVLWGGIDTYGKGSLYRKLFLNRAMQQIDPAFQPDAFGHYLQDPAAKLAAHQPAILAAFRIREEELAAIVEVARVIGAGGSRAMDTATDALNVGNLSVLYRHVVLAKALKLRVTDFCRLIAVFDAVPFSNWDVQQAKFVAVAPENTVAFVTLVEAIKAARFKAVDLEYILKGTLPADSKLGLDRNKALLAARAIRDDFAAIEQNHPTNPPEPLTLEILTAKLGLTFQPEVVARFLDILQGKFSSDVKTTDNLNIVIREDLAGKYSYVKASGRLATSVVMSNQDLAELVGLSIDGPYQASVNKLFTAPETFISENFGGFITNMVEASAKLLDHPAQALASTLEERLAYVYERFVPMLKARLRRDAITQRVAALIGLGDESTDLLLRADFDALATALSTAGYSAQYFSNTTWTAPAALSRTDEEIAFDWDANAPDPAVSADNFTVRWQAYLAAPASGEYTLIVEVAELDEAFKLYLDGTLVYSKTGGVGQLSTETLVTLNAGQMHLLRLEYAEANQNAGVSLKWKRTTSAPEIIPATAAYPAKVLDDFVSLAGLFHRAARCINGLRLTAAEVKHLRQNSADFDNVDFKAVTAGAWQRLAAYADLRETVPQAQALLTDVFALANRINPAPTVVDLKALLVKATAWDAAGVDYLVDIHFGLGVDKFKNEIALRRMRAVLAISTRTGLTAKTVVGLGGVEAGFDEMHANAQKLKNAVRALYGDEDWQEIAGRLSDLLRENQRQALVAYLLTRKTIQDQGVRDAEGLFEYLLIDVQMCACMDTSRIVQANAAVQMFIQRCLLNLESIDVGGVEEGVPPGAIDQARWAWMKNYRVWEANRKVFCYPENWLRPEWRMDRSEFFKELESYLVQNDITDRSVEQSFRNYLASLNEVANLEVCGQHEERQGEDLRYLHVFARTHNAPYKFFYRKWDQFEKWSAWQKVPVDIRCVEAGENSGVHLIPVVWKKRLFLFWPEFMLVQEARDQSNKSPRDMADNKTSQLKAISSWQIRLAWSEYVDGKWSPKKVTKEFINQTLVNPLDKEAQIRWSYEIDFNQQLRIISDFGYDVWWIRLSEFRLSDITSCVEISRPSFFGGVESGWIGYAPAFMHLSKTGTLQMMGDDYLSASTKHNVLVSPAPENLENSLRENFFFNDAVRTYFVKPVSISWSEWVYDPGAFKPFLPDFVDDSRFRIPVNVPPHIGPDDLFPGTGPIRFAQPMMISIGGSGAAPMMARMHAGVSGAGEAKALSVSYEHKYAFTGSAFGGLIKAHEGLLRGYYEHHEGAGLEFHTFYHPYSSQYVTNLNQANMAGLMESDTRLPSDEGSTFENYYQPNFNHGLVQKPADFTADAAHPLPRTYYKENVCFDPKGANSLYNWELFFHAPLYIATQLSRNGRFEEAMKWFHYIFDPTTNEPAMAGNENARYWKVLPFKTTPSESLEDLFRRLADPANGETTIADWRDHPFDPHRVASNRPIAYMKHVVIEYVRNLLDWGDSLFHQDSRESVNEALQLYVIAGHVLGPRPEFVPKRGEIKAQSYQSLEDKWDDFSNALVELENIFPYSSAAPVTGSTSGPSLLGVGSAFYFCIPSNEKLLESWDTVADRLYKIRHCENIAGVERKLALFAPPIDPAALIQAAAQGLSLGSILADLNSPPPHYRFTTLLQKANEFCADVKALGAALLATLEKKDAEELGRLRASHETQMLELMRGVKECQALEARANMEALFKSKDTALFRLHHYQQLLGDEPTSFPVRTVLPPNLTADSPLPDFDADTISPDVDESLVDGAESGVKLLQKEQRDMILSEQARSSTNIGSGIDAIGGLMNFIPGFSGNIQPYGIGLSISYGGSNIAGGMSGIARFFHASASDSSSQATMAAKVASFIRREQDWTLQANQGIREIVQIEKQIVSAEIRWRIALKELQNHAVQIENTRAVELFLRDKFTNQELYQWMKEQLLAVHKQSYNLAYDLAKKAEQAYRFELGIETSNFIQYGYWDDAKQGLAAGEKLQLALRQLDKSYLEENRRELELTKTISLARLDPLALIQLRQTGKCFVSIPEEVFDLDFRGHYFRRLTGVRLTVPCVAGPYTSVNCSLRLLNNSIRVKTSMNDEGNYEHTHDDGVWMDDDRFRTNRVPVTAIATSTAQNDPGLFEFNFRDERYLPFWGGGVISAWQFELESDPKLRQIDYSTITDVLLHLNYTARETGGTFKDKVQEHLLSFLSNSGELPEQPLAQMLSLVHEFPTQWHKFLHPSAAGGAQELGFTIDRDRLPFLARNRAVVPARIDLLARCTDASAYRLILSYVNKDGDSEITEEIVLPAAPATSAFAGLHKVTLDDSTPAADGSGPAGLVMDELDLAKPLGIKLRRSTTAAGDYTKLATNPDEVEDLFLVVHFELTDLP